MGYGIAIPLIDLSIDALPFTLEMICQQEYFLRIKH